MSKIIDLETGSVLLVNKPISWTSFDVTNKIKHLILRKINRERKEGELKTRKAKVGHAGTLDPLATGLLIVCVGKETKNIDQYMGMPKVYTGSFFLGAITPSYDRETEPVSFFETKHITEELIFQTAKQFLGEQSQVPPAYSAIQKEGVRAYVSARAGEEVILEPRRITLFDFEITSIDLPLVSFNIKCSKGTYIRALARDFGKALGSGAYLYSLCRTQIGDFHLSDAKSMEEIAAELGETLENFNSSQ